LAIHMTSRDRGEGVAGKMDLLFGLAGPRGPAHEKTLLAQSQGFTLSGTRGSSGISPGQRKREAYYSWFLTDLGNFTDPRTNVTRLWKVQPERCHVEK